MLALVDTLHLISSALTFSIANLSPAYASLAWYYVVPYSLPIAQVSLLSIQSPSPNQSGVPKVSNSCTRPLERLYILSFFYIL